MSSKIPNVNRRSLLKWTAGAAAVSIAGGAAARSAGAAGKGGLATLIDLSLCDGCVGKEIPACVAACKAINLDTIPPISEPIPEPWPRPKAIEDWSRKKEIVDRLTPYNYLYVHKADIDMDGRRQTLYIPRRCMHCDNPACATICPFSANHKYENGAVVIDQNLCFGGAKCKAVCPWEIPQRQSGVGVYLHVLPGLMGNGVMYKCDLCAGRLAEGKTPGCIEACPRQAMLIGPRAEIERQADERVRKMNGFLYGRKENGGTATLYVSPVSFERIDSTMVKGPGRPSMTPGLERRMADTDPLGKAVLAAPVLGLAVGAFGWFAGRRGKIQKGEKGNG